MSIDIFIRRGGSPDIEHRKVDKLDLTSLKRELDSAFGPGDLYLEDEEEALALDRRIESTSLFIHHSRCKRIAVTVRYAGKTFEQAFAPGTTLKKVKRRAEKKLGINPTDGAELSLQIAGTDVRPDEATHVGSLADPKTCSVIFDLVPSDRING